MSADLPALQAEGARVRVSTVRESDLPTYRTAVQRSARRLAEWNPVNPDDLVTHLRAQSRTHRTFLVRARVQEGEHAIVGKVNVTGIARGRLLSGGMGYDAYDPYAGRGLFAEGLRLVVGLAFAPEPHGLGLHRLEASVQPGNIRSAGLLRSLGFQEEGFSPRFLWLPDSEEQERWRDHDRYALTMEEWPGEGYPPPRHRRAVVLVNGMPGSGRSALAARLAQELGVPLLSEDRVTGEVADALPADVADALPADVADALPGGVADALPAGDVVEDRPGCSRLGTGAALWALLSTSPRGGVVEGWFGPGDAAFVESGLRRAGLEPASVPEIRCEAPATPVATAGRPLEHPPAERTGGHGSRVRPQEPRADLAGSAAPRGRRPVIRVDTTEAVGRRDIVLLALRVRAGMH